MQSITRYIILFSSKVAREFTFTNKTNKNPFFCDIVCFVKFIEIFKKRQ